MRGMRRSGGVGGHLDTTYILSQHTHHRVPNTDLQPDGYHEGYWEWRVPVFWLGSRGPLVLFVKSPPRSGRRQDGQQRVRNVSCCRQTGSG